MIIAATLKVVAAIASRIINLEKDFCELKAILRAITAATFNRHGFRYFQNYTHHFNTTKPISVA
jgi:hypothetical protein